MPTDERDLVTAVYTLMKQHSASGPSGAGAITAALIITLIRAGYTKERAVKTFSDFWDAIAEQEAKR